MSPAEARYFSQQARAREMSTVDPMACLKTDAALWLLVMADGINALQGYCLQVASNGSQTTA